MLETRVLATLKLFDLQSVPLTLLEVHKFLLAEKRLLGSGADGKFDISPISPEDHNESEKISTIQEILANLIESGEVETYKGFFCLMGRKETIDNRLSSYRFGIKRESRIRRFLPYTKYIPFIRGIAIGGSQSLGIEGADSDIDLFVITHSKYIWTARTFLTLYFQFFGIRRYKNFITNRFCLNHYVSGPKVLSRDTNLYTAMEYLRLRPVVGFEYIQAFKIKNQRWLGRVFPNLALYNEITSYPRPRPWVQRFLELVIKKLFSNRLEEWLASWQLKRIKKEDLIFVGSDELSFHHVGKQKRLLEEFYGYLNRLLEPKLEVVVTTEDLYMEVEESVIRTI